MFGPDADLDLEPGNASLDTLLETRHAALETSLETGNASLARLARTSRRIAAIAQPYVFHYFATGRQIELHGDSRIAKATLPNEDNRLALFLRTLLQRPELAVRVKALRLAPQQLEPADPKITRQNRTTTAVEVFRQARSKLGALVDINESYFPSFSWDVHGDWLSDSAIYYGLEQLATVLCPNIDTLVLGDEHPRSGHWSIVASRKCMFPSLKKVELVLYDSFSPLALGQQIFDSAPNIKTLRVAHPTRPRQLTGITSWARSWTTTLPSVRSLVIADISVLDLAMFVKSCPQLCDLEYRHHGRIGNGLARGLEVLEALQPARKTLRRLLLVIMMNLDPRGRMVPNACVGTLRDFNALEELVINQNQVAAGFLVDAPLTNLTNFLPRSIKRVEFLNIWCNFNPDLEGLLQDAPVMLPNLRSLRFSYFELGKDHNPAHWFPCDKDEHEYERVRGSFEAISISLVWDGTHR